MRSLLPPTKKIQTELSISTLTFEDNIDLVMNSNSWDRQRRKNLGSRVALLPGKFLRIWKVFARITEKKPRCLPIFWMNSKLSGFFQTTANFPDDFETVRIFQITANFPDYFITVQIFPDDCHFYG